MAFNINALLQKAAAFFTNTSVSSLNLPGQNPADVSAPGNDIRIFNDNTNGYKLSQKQNNTVTPIGGGGSGTIVTDGTSILGNGTSGNKIRLKGAATALAGQVPTSDGAGAINFATPASGAATSFTFSPTGSGPGDLALLGAIQIAATALPAGTTKIIYFDYSGLSSNFTFPTGTWDFGTNTLFVGLPQTRSFVLETIFNTGTTLANVFWLEALNLVTNSAANIQINVPNLYMRGCSVNGLSSVPFFKFANSTTQTILLDDCALGAYSVDMNTTTSNILTVDCANGTTVNGQAITGVASQTLRLNFDATSYLLDIQSLFGGSINGTKHISATITSSASINAATIAGAGAVTSSAFSTFNALPASVVIQSMVVAPVNPFTTSGGVTSLVFQCLPRFSAPTQPYTNGIEMLASNPNYVGGGFIPADGGFNGAPLQPAGFIVASVPAGVLITATGGNLSTINAGTASLVLNFTQYLQ